MNRKNKKTPDFFLDIDKIEEMVDDMLSRMEETGEFDPDKPIVMGFSIKIDPKGQTQFVEINPASEPSAAIEAQSEPLVEIQNQEHAFLLTVELAGIQKEHLRLHGKARELTISTLHRGLNYYKKVTFAEEINPKGVQAAFQNGILEIVVPKKNKIDGTPIPLR